MPEIAFYGLASAAAILLAALSRYEQIEKTLAAMALFAMFAASNITIEHRALWPIMDALMGMAFILAWLDAPSPWKAHLFGAYMMQCLCHVAYHLALVIGWDIGYVYTAALNALFVLQLWIVASDGAKRGRDYMRDWGADFSSRIRRDGMGALAFKAWRQ